MTTPLPRREDLADRLSAALARTGVPGASIGVRAGDEVVTAAAGTTRLDADGVPVTPGTLFLVGSVTKLWTAALVLQLAEQGALALDDRLADRIPEPFAVEDPRAREVTLRQLLSHTSGLAAEAAVPPERGDGAVAAATASPAVRDLPTVAAAGQLHSYSNVGYNLLGRAVEVAAGSTWDAALATRLAAPLGLRQTATLPEDVLLHRAALGHLPDAADDGGLTPVAAWSAPRGDGPCGGTLATSVADLLTFARAVTRPGLLLSQASVAAMCTPAVALPPGHGVPAWGLGWAIASPADPLVLWHGGNTNGQHSTLWVLPEHDLAVAVLTNGGRTHEVREGLAAQLLDELAGYASPMVGTPAGEGPPDPQAVAGVYA
ncbi:MAG TPA: serine hydrolase domain-containing protein, partial [Kineosporiaceae bacterium]|nr:serine hydrolase domain-containing protein [Kineosporiaceae bacterium]